MVIGDGMVMKFGNEQDRKKQSGIFCRVGNGTVDQNTVSGQKTVHIVDINTVSVLMTSDNQNNIVVKDFQDTFVYLQTSFPQQRTETYPT